MDGYRFRRHTGKIKKRHPRHDREGPAGGVAGETKTLFSLFQKFIAVIGCKFVRFNGINHNGCPDVFIHSPLRRAAVIRPVFIQRYDPVVFRPDEGRHMERAALILWINVRDRNGEAVQYFDPFHGPVPLSGIFAVGDDEFIHREMLVRAVPVYVGVRGEICSDLRLVLRENRPPESFYIHAVPLTYNSYTATISLPHMSPFSTNPYFR